MTAATIFALATPPGRSGVAVIRISGPEAGACLRSFGASLPMARMASLRALDDRNGSLIDQALIVYFQAPFSFTGEDVVEIQCHGSRAVISAILDHLGRLPFARPANAGEFSRQAFANEKLDIAQIEALQDLIEAETRAQREQALRGMSGELATNVSMWRASLIEALALCEAAIDFSDEPDIAHDTVRQASQIAGRLRSDLVGAMAATAIGERVRSGFTVVIAGPPNAGKSTLLNRLARKEAAIVSSVAGTTRDAVEVHVEIAGQAVMFVDTAGIRETEDAIEREGIRRTRARASEADLVLWLVPPGGDVNPDAIGKEVWTVATKVDIEPAKGCDISVSSIAPNGIDELAARLEDHLISSGYCGTALLNRDRHRSALTGAIRNIDGAVDSGPDHPERMAEDLRAASEALSSLVGRVSDEDVLDKVFSSFCIGK